MTEHIQIGDVAPRIQYTGNGSTTQFTYPFPIFAVEDLEVYLGQVRQTAGFVVTDAGASSGGSVTFDAAPASGVIVTLLRNLTIARTSDFQESGEFRAKVINDELDTITAALQQLAADLDRVPRLDPSDTTGPVLTLPPLEARKGRVFGWNSSDGTPEAIEPADASGTAVTSATGTAARLLADCAADIGNVLDFGATGGGVDGGSDIRIEGLFFDGRDEAANGIAGDCSRLALENVIIIDCTGMGIGKTGAYLRGARLAFVGVSGCDVGICNPIDSYLIACTANANRIGLQCLTGADSNHLAACRFEWNTEFGLSPYQARKQTLAACFFDRNYKAGVKLNGSSILTFAAPVFGRNGRNDIAGEDCHVLVEPGNADVTFTDIQTFSGKDDDDTGPETPKHAVRWTASPEGVRFVVGNLGGFTAAAFVGTQLADLVLLGISGVDNFAQGTRIYQTAARTGDVAAGATEVLAMGQAAVTTYDRGAGTLTVSVRDTVSAASSQATFQAVTEREGAGAALTFSAAQAEIGAPGTVAVGTAHAVETVVLGGSGKIRVTVTGHPFATGDRVQIDGVAGAVEANGAFQVTKYDADRIDLDGTSSVGTYTSGGTVRGPAPVPLLAENLATDGAGFDLRVVNASDNAVRVWADLR